MHKINVFALSITGIVICVTMIGVGMSPRFTTARPGQNDNLTINNKTQAFQIVSAVRDGEFVRLTFRNDYSQTINAFTLSGGPNSGVEVDLIHGDHEITPKATYYYRFFASNLEPTGSSDKPLKLTILNVVFDDGTGDGDPDATASINDRRRGEKAALAKIIPLLVHVSDSPDLETPEGIRRLKEKILAACEMLEKEQPSLARGIEHGKGYILGDIEQLESQGRIPGGPNFSSEFVKIKEHYEKVSAKLRK